MGLNFRWLRALGSEAAGPYELAAHPLGRRTVFAHELYSIWLRSKAGQRGTPDPGKGALILESDLRGGVAEVAEPRPFTPVVLVDGEPVATGFGCGDIDLEPGGHLLQVQSGASGAYWPIDVKPGLLTRMTSFVPQRVKDGPAVDLMRQFVLVPARAVPPRLGRLLTVVLSTVLGIVTFGSAAMAAESWGPPWPDSGFLRLLILSLIGAIAIAGAVMGYRIGLVIERVWNTAAEARLLLRLPIAEHGERQCPGGTWRPVDPRDEAPPRGVRLNLAYVQVPHRPEGALSTIVDEKAVAAAAKRARTFGEDYPPEVRPWVDAPRVVIDGEAMPAIWGVNEYRLSPGPHRVEIAVPPPPEVLLGEETEVKLGRDSRMELDVFETGSVDALARIEMTPCWDGWELQRYSAALEASSLSSTPFSRGQTVASTEPTSSSGPTSDAVRATVKSSSASRLIPPLLWATAA